MTSIDRSQGLSLAGIGQLAANQVLQKASFSSTGKNNASPFRYYAETKGGLGYIFNDAPIHALRAIVEDGHHVINSESLAYGLLLAVLKNDEHKFRKIMGTVYWLSMENYQETRVLKLLPWAVMVNNKTGAMSIVTGKDTGDPDLAGVANYGNASAADADIDVLTAMIMAVQKGWGDKYLRNFIYLYAENILAQDVHIYNTKHGPFSVLKQGGLIEAEGGKNEQDTLEYFNFYTSYPNYAFLRYIADYFASKGDYNDTGACTFAKQFRKLNKDTQKLMGELKDSLLKEKGLSVSNFPERVLLAIDDDRQVSIKTMQADKIASSRLFWRTKDPDLKYWQSQVSRTPKNYFEAFVKVLVEMPSPQKFAPIEHRFHLEDTLLKDIAWRQAANALSKHWYGRFEPMRDDRYVLEEYRDMRDQRSDKTPYAIGHRQTLNLKSKDVYTLQMQIEGAMDLMDGRDYVDQGVRIYEDALTKLLQKPEVKDTRFRRYGVTSPKKVAGERTEYVSHYVQLLRTMTGASDMTIRNKLNMLLAHVPDRKNIKNEVLRRVYEELVMIWQVLSPQERRRLRELSEQFNLGRLIAFKEQEGRDPSTPNHLDISIYGNRIDTHSMEVDEILALPVSITIRDAAIKELIKADLKGFDANKKYIGKKVQRFESYIARLPDEYKFHAVTLVIFQTDITLAEKQLFIFNELKKLSHNDPDYQNKYITLWRAYKLAVYKRINQIRDNYMDKEGKIKKNADLKPADIKELQRCLHIEQELIGMLFLYYNKGEAHFKGSASDKLTNLFREKRDTAKCQRYLKTYDYGDLAADAVGTLFWLGNDMRTLILTNPNFPPARSNQELRQFVASLKPWAEMLLKVYIDNRDDKRRTDYWENQHSIFAIKERIRIEKGNYDVGGAVNLQRDLWAKQKIAKRYAHYDAYVNLLAAEARLIGVVRGNLKNSMDRLHKIKIDEIMNLPSYKYVLEHVIKIK